MKRVAKIQTRDGKLHDNQREALNHAERVYGEALSRLAHRAVAMEKYSKMTDFIDANLGAFGELKALKQDIAMEMEPEEESC